MPEMSDAYNFRGRTVVDHQGVKIGEIDEVHYGKDGGRPRWALVHMGLFGTKRTFVPIRSARPAGEALRVAVTKAQVKDAPSIDSDHELSESDERRLVGHYGVRSTDDPVTRTGTPAPKSQLQEAGDG
jgi:hypothetical protein